MERGGFEHDHPQQKLARAFGDVIERMAGPIPERQTDDFMGMSLVTQEADARTKTDVGDIHISFVHSDIYAQFDFKLQHAAEIDSGNIHHEFGLREDGVIVRRRHVRGHGMVAPHTQRELDGMESLALITYLNNPGQDPALYQLFGHVTPEEQIEIDAKIREADAVVAEYSRFLEESEASHRIRPDDDTILYGSAA